MLGFTPGDPLVAWRSGVGPALESLGSIGVGFASPFVRTIPGSDAYVDEMMNEKIYIHELIDVIGHNRARYMHHMTANWCPVGLAERNQRCFGVWATVGSTGAWPQVVNLWELDGWDGLAANFEHELVGGGAQDPSLAEWWAVGRRAAARRIRPDRRAGAVEPDDRRADRRGRARRGLRARVGERPGGAIARLPRRARRVRSIGRGGARAALRRRLCRVAMGTDTEAVVIWAVPDLATWAAFEQAWSDGTLAPWRAVLDALEARVHRTLMVDAPLSPMRIGRQPEVGDRRPLSEIGP